jgi:hypothetical protein
MRFLTSFSIVLCATLFLSSCDEITAQEVLAEAEFSIDNVKYLEIEGGFCNIELNGYSGSSLKMEGVIKGSGDADKYEIIYREDNDRVKVWIERPNNIWRNINGLLRFDVPENVVVEADNSSGNIDADNLSAPEIELKASSGNVVAKHISGALYAKCSSGNITISDQKGNTTARASSGNLKIDEVDGNLTAHASSGNITVYNVNGDVSADCSSGNIKLRDIEGGLNAESSSGNIRGEGIMLTRNSRFKATSGNITIGLLNNEDDLSFDLDAGSGNLYAAGSSADDKLILKKGPITINGVTSSGNQRYTAD